jgi:hypothetical protein
MHMNYISYVKRYYLIPKDYFIILYILHIDEQYESNIFPIRPDRNETQTKMIQYYINTHKINI